jgi:hypothetical protein
MKPKDAFAMDIALRRGLAILALPALLAACGDEPAPLLSPDEAARSTVGSTLVECPTSETRSVTKTLDGLGGTVELDGHSITLPLGAVLLPTTLTLTVPASRYMELEITANGAESFDFEQAVAITISYARCTRSNIDQGPLTAWQIDPATKALIEHMGGTDDKDARALTFGSDHLSGFAIAN